VRHVPLIFIHIRKSGGRTMHSIVARQYRPDTIVSVEGRTRGEPQVPPIDDRTKLVIGLVDYGIHERVGADCAYVTMFREPVTRVVSLYRYVRATPQHFLYEQAQEMSVTDFVMSENDVAVANDQTRQIAGVAGSPTVADLERAKANLADFAAVGLMERFDESVLLFKRRFGWTIPWYVRKNVTPGDSIHVDTQTREVICAKNSLDIALYDFARRLFDEQVRREGALFPAKVALFRAANSAAGWYRAHRRR
jgi:hypothetical protein